MCLWSANYLWHWQEGFCNTRLHHKATGKVVVVFTATPTQKSQTRSKHGGKLKIIADIKKIIHKHKIMEKLERFDNILKMLHHSAFCKWGWIASLHNEIQMVFLHRKTLCIPIRAVITITEDEGNNFKRYICLYVPGSIKGYMAE